MTRGNEIPNRGSSFDDGVDDGWGRNETAAAQGKEDAPGIGEQQRQWHRATQDRRAPSAAEPPRRRLLAERPSLGYGRHRDLQEGLPPWQAEEAHRVCISSFCWLVLTKTIQDEQGERSLSRVHCVQERGDAGYVQSRVRWTYLQGQSWCVVPSPTSRSSSMRRCTGNESQAIVEYAPFQKIPTERKKVDARNNTIDKGMLHPSLHTARVTLRIR